MEIEKEHTALIADYIAWDTKNNGTHIFLVILGIALILILTVPDILSGCPPKQILTSFSIGLAVAMFPFAFACSWADQKSTKYTLSGFDFCIIHEKFPFLNKQYDLRKFTKFHIGNGRYSQLLYLYQDHGASVCIPIMGTIPKLIKAIDAVHKMQAK